MEVATAGGSKREQQQQQRWRLRRAEIAMYGVSWKASTTVGLVGFTVGASVHTRAVPQRRDGVACRVHAAGASGVSSSSAVVSAVGTGSSVDSVVPALYGRSSRRGRGLHGVMQCKAEQASEKNMEATVRGVVQEQPVIVFSKSWCPYCTRVKDAFVELGVEARCFELDGFVEEREIQDVLYEMTGQSTVPSVWIGGQHIGGCDDTMRLMRTGELEDKLVSAGAL